MTRRRTGGSEPRTARLVTTSVLIVALTQFGCTSFRARGLSPAVENPITISPSRPAVRVDGAAQLTLGKADGFVRLEQPIVWTSSDPEVLTVVSIGGERARIVGISPGNARVSVNTANGYSTWVTVRVYVNLARQGLGCRLISTLKCTTEGYGSLHSSDGLLRTRNIVWRVRWMP